MKLSRKLRSFGAAFVCAAMILCNVPLVRAADIDIPGYIIGESVFGNGTGPLQNRNGDPIAGTSGGDPATGNPNNNNVTVRNGVVDGAIYGSWTESGSTSNNSVTVTGNYPGSTVNDVYGGFVELGYAINNEVTIENNSRVRGNVAGGHADAITTGTFIGTTQSNTVTIRSGAIIEGDVYGGRSGSASDNIVNIEGGNIRGTVVGGGSDNTDALYSQYNEVNISEGSIVDGDIYGGLINIADALENSVYITGGLLSGSVYGGVTGMGNSLGNTVAIEGTVVNGGSGIVGGQSSQGDALGNNVSITNSRFINSSGLISGGLTSAGNANYNEVNIDGGEVRIQNVVGGASVMGNSNGNTVTIGETGGIFNISTLSGGLSTSGSANNNTVTVYRGTFTNVYGGTTSANGYASGNTVNIYGGAFNGNIIGGATTSGAANGNTINIFSGNSTFSANTKIYGGFTNSAGHDARSGNTLNIWKPITIAGIDNFEKYNFYLPAELKADDTMIAVTNGNGINGAINLENTKIEIGVYQGSKLKQGDTVVLIDEQGGFGFSGNPDNNVSNGSTLDDTSDLVHYRFGLTIDEDQLRASVLGASLDSRTDSIPEGFLSGLILANQGADAIASSAMDSAMTAAHKGPIQGLGGFGSLVVGKSEYNTGSDVDMIGVSVAAGLAIGADFVNSSLTVGPFFEYGRAEFDTTNSPADGQKVTGDGDSEYFGGGFLLRMDYKDVGLGRYFAEASVRAGRQKNDFSIYWPGEEAFSYSSTSPYYGVHLGYGGSWDVASSTALDIYGKYLFARGGDSRVSLSNGENIDFQAVTSNRIRGGSRLAYVPSDSLAISFGGAYEYEISGETGAAMRGYAINAPSLKGGTGIGEVVIGYKPSDDKLTSINVGIQGYSGKRQGVTASLFLRF